MITINDSQSIIYQRILSEDIIFGKDILYLGLLSLPIQITSTNGYNRQEFVNATFGNVSEAITWESIWLYIYDSGILINLSPGLIGLITKDETILTDDDGDEMVQKEQLSQIYLFHLLFMVKHMEK